MDPTHLKDLYDTALRNNPKTEQGRLVSCITLANLLNSNMHIPESLAEMLTGADEKELVAAFTNLKLALMIAIDLKAHRDDHYQQCRRRLSKARDRLVVMIEKSPYDQWVACTQEYMSEVDAIHKEYYEKGPSEEDLQKEVSAYVSLAEEISIRHPMRRKTFTYLPSSQRSCGQEAKLNQCFQESSTISARRKSCCI